ncbi:unnamed protein product [Tilletia controversa]|nr:hypothetical protein CF328_g2460 [Tilletia controversa]KAE8206537.1 hypothetical protein CF335_g1807 [Tilletia laevis]CAD6906231.1 unnamed protein product [Tilletia caries]CAD6899656.1 unnamed protein product [Tilletia controversa]CAD6905661.1 unnamed protein product [Tilletia laevis]
MFDSDDIDGDSSAAGLASTSSVSLEWHARGLTSSVYKARLPRSTAKGDSGREICVKITSLDLLVRPHNAEREVTCLARLQESDHFVKLLDAFISFPDPFSTNYEIILDLYPFELGQLLDDPAITPKNWSTSGPSSLTKANHDYAGFVGAVASGLAEGLQHMHSLGIAHRDIKPSNILLKPNGTPVYADFATAWEAYKADNAGSDADAAFEGDDGRGGLECAIGTGAYRPPEVLFSPSAGYDVYKVDIWELGATLASFFMPFQGGSTDGPDTDPVLEQDGYRDQRVRNDIGSKAAQETFWYETDPEDEAYGRKTEEPPRRETLFDGDRGEIALASSIFRILGLPDKQEEWPESASFRPSFERLPFERHRPTAPVSSFLPLTAEIQAVASRSDQIGPVLEVITEALRLSAAQRPDAERIARMLEVTKAA